MKLRIVFLFCLVAAFQISQSASQKYGTACGAGRSCDSRSGTVTCSEENVCSCPDSDTMIYDAQEDSCVVGQIGAMCYTRSLKNGRPESTCVPGAHCIPVTSNSANGICQSVSGGEKTLKHDASTATPTTTADTTTKTSKNKDGLQLEGEGDEDLSSLSVEDISDSTNGETSPGPVTQETTPHPGSRIGEVCQSNEDCFPSSSSCVELFCACDAGYITEFGGTKCSRMINYSCTQATECIANSTCAETNTCQCNSKFVMKNENQQCALMIDEPCKSKDDCLDNAECKSDGLTPDLVCMCEDGFPPAEDLTKCSGTSVNLHVALLAIGSITVLVNKM